MHQGVFDGSAVIGVLPEQGRIGSMQSGDNTRREPPQHLRCQTRSQSMWHGIMNMKNIELSRACHLCHFHRQGQGVVGARKQSVVRDLDPMEMKMFLRQLQPNRLSVAEEVNFM